MFSFIRFLIYLCRRGRHCGYCGQLSIRSQMTRDSSGTYFCNAGCQLDRSAEVA
jgi:hypothetical protein